MLEKMSDTKLTPQEDVYYELLRKYEKALYSLGMDDEEVANETAEYIQMGALFQKN
jgi:hypothetical protein